MPYGNFLTLKTCKKVSIVELSVKSTFILIDTDLRHALANLIAVVFGLHDGDTHIWYHMFCPDQLQNTYLTGFMVSIIMVNICQKSISYDDVKNFYPATKYSKLLNLVTNTLD